MAPTKNIADFLFRHTTFPPITRKQAKVIQRLAELDGLAEAEGWSVGDLYPQEELPEGEEAPSGMVPQWANVCSSPPTVRRSGCKTIQPDQQYASPHPSPL